jgi:hypothetical protein
VYIRDSTVITETMFFVEYTKVMVALGWFNEELLDSVEIIDLLSEDKICQSFPRFPYPASDTYAEVTRSGDPIICGGRFPAFHDDCFTFRRGQWNKAASMTIKSGNFAITRFPSSNESIDLLLTGGDLNDTLGELDQSPRCDILIGGSWKSIDIDLPIKIAYHCMILKNGSTPVVIGGLENGSVKKNTLILSMTTKTWKTGPLLNIGRGGHACSTLPASRMNAKESIIVVGGWKNNRQAYSSVEILDEGSNTWRLGPELPLPIAGATMVKHPGINVIKHLGDH